MNGSRSGCPFSQNSTKGLLQQRVGLDARKKDQEVSVHNARDPTFTSQHGARSRNGRRQNRSRDSGLAFPTPQPATIVSSIESVRSRIYFLSKWQPYSNLFGNSRNFLFDDKRLLLRSGISLEGIH